MPEARLVFQGYRAPPVCVIDDRSRDAMRDPTDPAVTFAFDPLNRLQTLTDRVETTAFTYGLTGLATEDGPFADDLLTYTYNQRLRARLTMAQIQATAWTQDYTYDAAKRLSSLTSGAGAFSYQYLGACDCSAGTLVKSILLPSGVTISNGWDNVARLVSTTLRNSIGQTLDSRAYQYWGAWQSNWPINAISKETRTDGSYVQYTGTDVLSKAETFEPNGSPRMHEWFEYTYDTAMNVSNILRNDLRQIFGYDNQNRLVSANRTSTMTASGSAPQGTVSASVNGVAAQVYQDRDFAAPGVFLADGSNQVVTVALGSGGVELARQTNSVYVPNAVSLDYDSNGNGLGFSVSQAYGCTYDDEDRVSAIVCQAAGYKSEFVYDGLGRRRLRQDFSYTGGSWIQTNLVQYVYDGRLVLQERWFNPLLSTTAPIKVVTYTRGIDRSGSPEGAGGIGGLLSRTESQAGTATHAFYHDDGRGNVSMLVNGAGAVVARYVYEPFGRLVSAQGPMAEANTYRFSSKEVHPQSGLVYFGARYYDPSLQRWLNRDPAGPVDGPNLYAFLGNNPINGMDPWGLASMHFTFSQSTADRYGVLYLPPEIVKYLTGVNPKNYLQDYNIVSLDSDDVLAAWNQADNENPDFAGFEPGGVKGIGASDDEVATAKRNMKTMLAIGAAGSLAVAAGTGLAMLADMSVGCAATAATDAAEGGIARVWTQSRIRAVKTEHIFSRGHLRNGILDLGSSRRAIVNDVGDVLSGLDKAGRLRPGQNWIRLRMNGHDATVRAFFRDGQLESLDIFKGISPRSPHGVNFLELRP